MFFTYILFSFSKNKHYIGHTGDTLEERIRKHNSNHKGFTGGIGDWELKYFETFDTKQEAHRRELEIKSWKSKRLVENLINKSKA